MWEGGRHCDFCGRGAFAGKTDRKDRREVEKIKVLIADDVMILRQGLKAVLEQDSGLEVVALAENGREAFEKSRVYEPDVVLMDMRMPEFDGAYGIQKLKENRPEIRVLVLTTFDDEETIERALSSGADGYILKEMEDERVIAAVKGVYAGMSIFGEEVYRTMRTGLQLGKGSSAAGAEETAGCAFTPRERDMLRLVAQGYDNKEIAAALFLAEGTVRNRISGLLEKLSLKDRTQLAVYSVKHGLDE